MIVKNVIKGIGVALVVHAGAYALTKACEHGAKKLRKCIDDFDKDKMIEDVYESVVENATRLHEKEQAGIDNAIRHLEEQREKSNIRFAEAKEKAEELRKKYKADKCEDCANDECNKEPEITVTETVDDVEPVKADVTSVEVEFSNDDSEFEAVSLTEENKKD